MIVYKEWYERLHYGYTIYKWCGWYLFGIIPLLKKRITIKEHGEHP